MSNFWDTFIVSTRQNSPRELYLEAIEMVPPGARCLDIAAGGLADSRDMLKRNYNVVAFDSSVAFIKAADDIDCGSFSATCSRMEDYNYGIEQFDYINAMFALPFINSKKFNETFKKIVKSLKPHGIFAFHLFGPDDAIVAKTKVATHSREQVEQLVKPYNVIKLKEIKKASVGSQEPGHDYQVIIQKVNQL